MQITQKVKSKGEEQRQRVAALQVGDTAAEQERSLLTGSRGRSAEWQPELTGGARGTGMVVPSVETERR